MRLQLLALTALLTLSAAAQEGRELLLPLPHRGAITTLTFSPDRHHLASGDEHGLVKVWNWPQGTLEATLQPPRGQERSLAWLGWNTSQELMCQGTDNRVRLYQVGTAREITGMELQREDNPCPLGQGRLAVVALGTPPQIRVYHLKDGSRVKEYPVPGLTGTGYVKVMTASPDGTRLAAFLNGPNLLVEWEAESGRLLRTQAVSAGQLPSLLAYSPQGTSLAAADRDLFVWREGALQTVPGQLGIRSLNWADEGRLRYLVCNNGTRLYQVEGGESKLLKEMAQCTGTQSATVDSGESVIGTQQGEILASSTGKEAVIAAESDFANCLAYHPSGQLLTGLQQGDILQWNLPAGRLERRIPLAGPIRALALTRDGKKLAVVTGQDDVVRILDFETGKVAQTIATHGSQRAGQLLQFSGDGRWLAVSEASEEEWHPQVQVYDLKTGKAVGKREFCQRLAFHPKLDRVALLRPEGLFEVDLLSGTEISHPGSDFRDCAYDPQGQLLAVRCQNSGSSSALVRLLPPDPNPEHPRSLPVQGFGPSMDQLSYDDRSQTWWLHGDNGALYRFDPRDRSIQAIPEGSAESQSGAWKVLPNGLLAVRSGRGTLEFWRPGQSHPEGELVMLGSGKEWLVTSQGGYFDGTAAAERQIEWRLDGQRYRVDQFFQQGYRPGLLREFFRGARFNDANCPLARKAAPPALEILSPHSGSQVEGREAEVRIHLTDQGQGFLPPRLYVNGHAMPQTTSRSESQNQYVFPARLTPGLNEIRVTSFDGSGTVESRAQVIRILCKAEARRDPVMHVVAVGVNQPPGCSPLKYAESDARALAEKLRSGLYAQTHIHLLCGPAADKPGLDEIFRQVAAQSEPQDTLVVFLAGHGSAPGGNYRFLLAGQNPESSTLGSPELASYMEGISAQKQFLVLDTCHAAAATPDFASRFAVTQQRIARGSGTFLLAACRPGERAGEMARLQHGLLTHSVLSGLGPTGAARNDLGEITVNALLQFVSADFSQLQRRYPLNQELFQFATGSDFPVVRRVP